MLEKFIELQKLFSELYENGLVGVGSDYVHVENELFKQFAQETECPITCENKTIGIELQIVYDGIQIITIL